MAADNGLLSTSPGVYTTAPRCSRGPGSLSFAACEHDPGAVPMKKAVRILGTRGIPGRHGGFESFVQRLAPDLVARGWRVTVYCQQPAGGKAGEDEWRGVSLVHIPVGGSASAGSVLYDWKATVDAARHRELAVV